MRRLLLLLAVALLGACDRSPPAPISVGTTPAPPAVEANATVVHVIDGDTVIARVGDTDEHVRLIGINSPETKDPDKPVECYGPEASAELQAMLPEGTPVRLERDVEARDQYDRLLAYVFRASDGLFVNAALGREGFVRSLWITPNGAYRAEVDGAIAEARAAGRGLWGACAAPVTSAP